MGIRIHKWFVALSPGRQLLVLFLLNGVFWFCAWECYLWLFKEKGDSLGQRILFAIWMALLMTVPINLKKIKHVFKRQPKHDGQ